MRPTTHVLYAADVADAAYVSARPDPLAHSLSHSLTRSLARPVPAGWKLSIGGGPKYSRVKQSWGWQPSLDKRSKGRLISGRSDTNDWLSIDACGEVSVGVQVQGTSKRLRPKRVWLNGVKCSMI